MKKAWAILINASKVQDQERLNGYLDGLSQVELAEMPAEYLADITACLKLPAQILFKKYMKIS